MEERTLDIDKLFQAIKRKAWFIILITIITTFLGVLYSLTMDTMYCARVKVYIGESEQLINSYTEDQMKYYSRFMDTFKEIIVIDDFLNNTLNSNHIELTANQVRDGLSFVSSSNSPILEINYTSSNQMEARDVLKALANEYAKQSENIMPNAKVQVVDSVKVYTIEPNTQKVIILAAMCGLILSLGVVFIANYLDNTIRKKSDLEDLLAIPILGQIPHDEEIKEKI